MSREFHPPVKCSSGGSSSGSRGSSGVPTDQLSMNFTLTLLSPPNSFLPSKKWILPCIAYQVIIGGSIHYLYIRQQLKNTCWKKREKKEKEQEGGGGKGGGGGGFNLPAVAMEWEVNVPIQSMAVTSIPWVLRSWLTFLYSHSLTHLFLLCLLSLKDKSVNESHKYLRPWVRLFERMCLPGNICVCVCKFMLPHVCVWHQLQVSVCTISNDKKKVKGEEEKYKSS